MAATASGKHPCRQGSPSSVLNKFLVSGMLFIGELLDRGGGRFRGVNGVLRSSEGKFVGHPTFGCVIGGNADLHTSFGKHDQSVRSCRCTGYWCWMRDRVDGSWWGPAQCNPAARRGSSEGSGTRAGARAAELCVYLGRRPSMERSFRSHDCRGRCKQESHNSHAQYAETCRPRSRLFAGVCGASKVRVLARFNHLWANHNLAECNFQVSAYVGGTRSGFTCEFVEALAPRISRRTLW